LVDAVADRLLADDEGAKGVVAQCLPGIDLLHQRHVLVGGGVKQHRWAMLAQQAVDAGRILHVADRTDQRDAGMKRDEFLAQRVQARLADLEQHDAARSVLQDLPAQLRANRAAGSGHHDDAVGEEVMQRLRVELHRVAAEQVLGAHLAHVGHAGFVADQVGHAGH
jgi:hypothetical protein